MSLKSIEERMEELQRQGLDKSISVAIAADEHYRAKLEKLKAQEEKNSPVVETPVESARPVVSPVVETPVVETPKAKENTLADKKDELIKKLEEKVEEVKDEVKVEVTKK